MVKVLELVIVVAQWLWRLQLLKGTACFYAQVGFVRPGEDEWRRRLCDVLVLLLQTLVRRLGHALIRDLELGLGGATGDAIERDD